LPPNGGTVKMRPGTRIPADELAIDTPSKMIGLHWLRRRQSPPCQQGLPLLGFPKRHDAVASGRSDGFSIRAEGDMPGHGAAGEGER